MMIYDVLEDSNLVSLIERVNGKAEIGWEPVGPAQAVERWDFYDDKPVSSKLVYLQTLSKDPARDVMIETLLVTAATIVCGDALSVKNREEALHALDRLGEIVISRRRPGGKP